MSGSVSRRDLFAGLLAAGLAWLGLGRRESGTALPSVALPNTEAPSRLPASSGYLTTLMCHTTTCTYDGHSHTMTKLGPSGPSTFTYKGLGEPPSREGPQQG
jgi:hypothetical protein